jgi:hypothetical protein
MKQKQLTNKLRQFREGHRMKRMPRKLRLNIRFEYRSDGPVKRKRGQWGRWFIGQLIELLSILTGWMR